MRLRAISGRHARLSAALAALDPGPLRSRLLGSMVVDAVDQARLIRAEVNAACDRIGQYRRALETVQGQCVREALTQLPFDRVVRRFARIWEQSDPTHIKIMRQTGRAVEWPLKAIIKTVRRFKAPQTPAVPSASENASVEKLEMDLLNAANNLYRKCLDRHLPMDGPVIAAPEAVHAAQIRLGQKPWQATLETILDQKNHHLGSFLGPWQLWAPHRQIPIPDLLRLRDPSETGMMFVNLSGPRCSYKHPCFF